MTQFSRLTSNFCRSFSKMKLVFVYGTLKRGEPNHHLLETESNGFREFLGLAKSDNKFPLVVASRYNIPFVLDSCGNGNHIEGEIYRYTYLVDKCILLKNDLISGLMNRCLVIWMPWRNTQLTMSGQTKALQ